MVNGCAIVGLEVGGWRSRPSNHVNLALAKTIYTNSYYVAKVFKSFRLGKNLPGRRGFHGRHSTARELRDRRQGLLDAEDPPTSSVDRLRQGKGVFSTLPASSTHERLPSCAKGKKEQRDGLRKGSGQRKQLRGQQERRRGQPSDSRPPHPFSGSQRAPVECHAQHRARQQEYPFRRQQDGKQGGGRRNCLGRQGGSRGQWRRGTMAHASHPVHSSC